jgi:8-oxo-dGTP diphosphatase
MAYFDTYRLSVHAVILDESQRVLMVKTTYGAKGWTLPGGAIDPGETIHETLIRECKEELNADVKVSDCIKFAGATFSNKF